jgi:5,10-methylenetetrahydromethanopterin reductase
VAKRAEELGFTHAWFFDTPLVNAELFVAMGAAAVKTSKIKLCTGVLIPPNRLAPVTASGLATLNALAPGRIIFGVSTGFTGRRAMGLGPITLAQMEKYIEMVEQLLQDKIVDWSEGPDGETHKIKFLNPDPELINIKDRIPLFISAFGPKSRALTAKLGAGWMTASSNPSREKAELDDFRAAWIKNNRNPDDLYVSLGVSGCVLDEGEPADSPRSRAQAGPQAAMAFHNMAEVGQFGSLAAGPQQFRFPAELEAYQRVYQAYEPSSARYINNHRGHLMFLRPEEKHITANVIRGLSVTGTLNEIVERVRGIKERGYQQVRFNTVPGQEEDMLNRWSEVMARV